MGNKNTKYSFGNEAAHFSENFVTTLMALREQKQKEQEFQQKMGLEMRQQKFMSSYYDALKKDREFDNQLAEAKFGVEQRSGYDESMDSLSRVGTLGEDLNKQFDGTFSPFEKDKRYTPKMKEGTAPSYQIGSKRENGKDMQYFYNPKNPTEQIPFGEEYHAPTGNTTVNVDSGEYFDMTKSDDPSRTYDALTKAKWNQEKKKFEVLTADGNKEFTQPELDILKSRLMREIEDKTNNEARRIGKKVKNFYLEFQEYLKDAKNGILTPENIDESVNEDYPDAPTETRDAIKSLLRKRIR